MCSMSVPLIKLTSNVSSPAVEPFVERCQVQIVITHHFHLRPSFLSVCFQLVSSLDEEATLPLQSGTLLVMPPSGNLHSRMLLGAGQTFPKHLNPRCHTRVPFSCFGNKFAWLTILTSETHDRVLLLLLLQAQDCLKRLQLEIMTDWEGGLISKPCRRLVHISAPDVICQKEKEKRKEIWTLV